MVYLPPDFVTKIRSGEWGTSVRATIMTFFEIPLLIRIRSPSRMVTCISTRPATGEDAPTTRSPAPLLRKLLAEYAATGLPPAYLPKHDDPQPSA